MARHRSDVVHVRLPSSMHHKVKMHCASLGETMQAFVERALLQQLEIEGRQLQIDSEASASSSCARSDSEADEPWCDTRGLSARLTEAIEHLCGLDWGFNGSDTREHVHGLHPYPAKFIPQIPEALIDSLHPGDDSAVLDPFCGSGTTLVEAQRAGLPSIGTDINPLACLLAQVKTTPLPNYRLESLEAVSSRAFGLFDSAGSVGLPPIPRLDHWFKRDVAEAVAIVLQSIKDESTNRAEADALRIALSSILVRVSNQESDVRYAAVNKTIDGEGVIEAFVSAGHDVIGRLQDRFGCTRECSKATVAHLDARQLERLPNGNTSVGLVVTSPPYPNAYEYWLYHKYRMYWLGMDPVAARASEIGARPHYSRKNGLTAEDFARDMTACLAGLAKLLPYGRFACILVGNSTIRGEAIDNSTLLERVGAGTGFRLRARIPRRIPDNRKSFNPAIGSIRKENILVFERALV